MCGMELMRLTMVVHGWVIQEVFMVEEHRVMLVEGGTHTMQGAVVEEMVVQAAWEDMPLVALSQKLEVDRGAPSHSSIIEFFLEEVEVVEMPITPLVV
jgi:hypothetical protein